MGGRKGNATTAATERFDPALGCWQSLPSMQQPRAALTAAALGGLVYAVGGQHSRSIYRCCQTLVHTNDWNASNAAVIAALHNLNTIPLVVVFRSSPPCNERFFCVFGSILNK